MGKIQIHRAGLTVSASPAEMDDLRRQFQQRHAIVLEHFLEPGLLAQVQDAVGQAKFLLMHHGNVGTELSMARGSLAVHILQLLTNSPRLFTLIQEITGCPPVGYYDGRIYRLLPSPEFFDRWHDDRVEGRQIGMSINLGAEPYQGGVFELRKGRNVLCRLANTIPGNALLFRIRQGLKHRVTRVEGAAPKTAFAGWFVGQGNRTAYLDLVRGAAPSKVSSLLG